MRNDTSLQCSGRFDRRGHEEEYGDIARYGVVTCAHCEWTRPATGRDDQNARILDNLVGIDLRTASWADLEDAFEDRDPAEFL